MMASALTSRARSLRAERRPRISAMHSRRPWPVSKTRVWVLTWYGTGRGLGEAEAAGREEVEAGREVDCIVEEVVETRPLTKSWEEGGESREGQWPTTETWIQLCTRSSHSHSPGASNPHHETSSSHPAPSRVARHFIYFLFLLTSP